MVELGQWSNPGLGVSELSGDDELTLQHTPTGGEEPRGAPSRVFCNPDTPTVCLAQLDLMVCLLRLRGLGLNSLEQLSYHGTLMALIVDSYGNSISTDSVVRVLKTVTTSLSLSSLT